MNRLPGALAAAIAATVSVAGCANVGALAGHGKKLPRMPAPLPGKYQALAVSFPGRDAGIASISGYPGQSATLRSWIDRTADGGKSWVASGPASGQHQPGAQAGMAFVSAGQGWAYLPGLFFTRDGGVTWRAERTRFPLTGPVAVAGTSTWVVGYACVRGVCPATIYATRRVGGALRRLADQPTATGTVEVMQRPTASVAWLLLTGPRPRYLHHLLTTSDAGRSWTARPLPYPEQAGQLSAAGPGSLWLICYARSEGASVPGVLYRTADGGHTWMRIARENSLRVYAVGNLVAWAVQSTPSGSGILRTTDGGRAWHTVLTPKNTDVQAFAPQGPDGAQAVGSIFSASGWRFVAYRTRSAGKTWHRVVLST